jgi:tyrosine-protein phosphatase
VDAKGHLVPIVTVVEKDQPSMPMSIEPQMLVSTQEQLPIERSRSLKRQTINFSKPLPLRREEDTDSQMQDAPPPIFSPRSDEFHMAAVGNDITTVATQNHNSSGIFSPFTSAFHQNPFDRLNTTPERPAGGLSLHEQIRQMPSLHSSPSPPQSKTPQSRNDSLEPTAPFTTPPRQRSIRTKFSSPSMREQIRLQQLQTQIEGRLPHSPGSQHSWDDIDALMSPRATEFTVNPFHELLSPRPKSPQPQVESKCPGTPKSTESDPRSPAQHGISPIVRNIFDVL